MTFRDRPFAVWGLPLVTLLVTLLVLGTDAGGWLAQQDKPCHRSKKAGPRLAADGPRMGAAWFTAADDEPRVLVSTSPDAGTRMTRAPAAR